MKFEATKLGGVFVIEVEPFEDARGFFARSWSEQEFAAQGLNTQLAESTISFSKRAGTLRGMHLQSAPHAQVKLVRCTMGAIYDVVIDLRPESPTFKQWVPVELTAANRRQLYVPESCAHGFQTLVDDTEICYFMTEVYAPQCERGVRWDDPAFGIEWPPCVAGERIIIERDRQYPDFVG
jgi:dTDP-4-dehydrorhamnose 3,5-epimerase